MIDVASGVGIELLGLMARRGVGRRTVHQVVETALQAGQLTRDTLRESADTILRDKGIANDSDSIRGNVEETAEQLALQSVGLLIFGTEEYPRRLVERLGADAPPVLFYAGSRDLLSRRSVGFCGSRRASETGLATAADCASQLASEGWNVISGYAVGVDRAAHAAALRCSGVTTAVLVDGITRFSVRTELREWWNEFSTLVISEFPPRMSWSTRNAMVRNRTIAALSDAMIVVEAGETGGSIAAGRDALKLGVPVFAPVYGDERESVGNQMLIREGAVRLHKSRSRGHANLDPIREHTPMPRGLFE